ncbi:MAG: carboxypeptidase-like regulatory domain-containing protein [Chitinophagaceae bacterium]
MILIFKQVWRSFGLLRFICLLTFLFPRVAAAQVNSISIRGSVTDIHQKPVAVATVSLLPDGESIAVKWMVAGKEGRYFFDSVKPGKYLLLITAIGYKEKTPSLLKVQEFARQKTDDILLEENGQLLKDVTIVAKKPLVQVKADRAVLNIAGSLTATGSSALELLRRAPGLRLNNDEDIVINGKNGVAVYVDGNKINLAGKDLTDDTQFSILQP